MSKTKADWMPTGKIKYVDMGNGFTLIKFVNEMDCDHVFLSTLVCSGIDIQSSEMEERL